MRKVRVSFKAIISILLVCIVYFSLLQEDHDPVSDPRAIAWKRILESADRSVKQTDPGLISRISDHYLIPPPGPNTALNFNQSIKLSPVAAVVRKILRNKTHGFFLECGAYDGEFLSNTIELEHYFKWEGLLVEADPKYHAELIGKRRKAWVAPVCLSPIPHPMTLTMIRHKKWGALSNIPELRDEPPPKKDYGFQFEVPCFPLYSLVVAALNRKELDYLSLDVEGAEWDIIQTIPFDKMKIKVISFEYSMNRKDNRASLIGNYLEEKGYVKQAKAGDGGYVHDYVYAHRSILKD